MTNLRWPRAWVDSPWRVLAIVLVTAWTLNSMSLAEASGLPRASWRQ